MKLEEKLVSLRKEKGLSQLQLAEMMNVSRQAISRWETGVAVPSTENLKYLGNLYDVSLDYLLNDTADELEKNKGVIDKPEEVVTSVPDWVNNSENFKRKIAKRMVIVLGLLALVVTIYICLIVGNESDFVPINDVQKKPANRKSSPKQDLTKENFVGSR